MPWEIEACGKVYSQAEWTALPKEDRRKLITTPNPPGKFRYLS